MASTFWFKLGTVNDPGTVTDILEDADATDDVIACNVDASAREASISDTVDSASSDELTFMSISYDTTSSLMLVTVTVDPGGKTEPRDDVIASSKYPAASSSSAGVIIRPAVPVWIFSVMLADDKADDTELEEDTVWTVSDMDAKVEASDSATPIFVIAALASSLVPP